MSLFGDSPEEDEGYCLGARRYVIVDYLLEDEDDYNLSFDELNSSYPKEVRTAAYRQYSIFKENIQELGGR